MTDLTGDGGGKLAVAVFCGSRPGHDPAHAAVAQDLGTAVGEMGWRLVYGGGDVGLMGVTARAALPPVPRCSGISRSGCSIARSASAI